MSGIFSLHTIPIQRPPQKPCEPAGKCIYCGSVGNLTREHIVPDGLSGDLYIPSASCESCQKITHNFETGVLQDTFRLSRGHFGISSRKNKKRKDKNPKLYRGKDLDGNKVTREHIVGMPYFTALPAYKSPPTLVPCTDQMDDFTFHYFYSEDFVRTSAEDSFNLRPFLYFRLIAKIAHCFAWYCLGGDKFEPFIDLFIVNTTIAVPREFIGCSISAPPPVPNDTLHWLSCSVEGVPSEQIVWRGSLTFTSLVIVRIQLFANRPGTPIYEVVVGRYIPLLGMRLLGENRRSRIVPNWLNRPIAS